MKKPISKMLFILTACVASGYLLIVCSYALPLQWPETLRNETTAILYQEGLYPADKVSGRHIDNWADSYSLLIASYEGEEGPFEKAANAYYYRSTYNPYDWLSGRTGPEQPVEKASYSRYWHGTVPLLRLLMCRMNFAEIRRLNTVCLAALLLTVFIVLQLRIPESVIPFLLTIFLLAPTAIGSCLEYSGVHYIMLLMTILIAIDWKPINAGTNVKYLFFASGILTAYIDFLSAPTISLSIPLIFLFLRRKKEKGLVSLAAFCVLYWVVGYVGMWGGKWLIAALSQGDSFVKELLYSIRQRSSASDLDGLAITRVHALSTNVKQLFSDWYINMLIILYTLLTAIRSMVRYRQITRLDIRNAGILSIPLLISVGWYLVFANHSIVHFWLHTYRTAAPALFGILCAIDLGNIQRGLNPNLQRNEML